MTEEDEDTGAIESARTVAALDGLVGASDSEEEEELVDSQLKVYLLCVVHGYRYNLGNVQIVQVAWKTYWEYFDICIN